MQSIEKLKTTDDLGEHGGGIWKKWPWKDSDHYELMSDLILKAKYSIQDFNSTINGGFSPNPKDTVYLVALATWIKDAYWQIKRNCLRKEIENDFEFSKHSELDDASKYLQVVRSAVIAHPLNSTRHQDYGFGSEGRICIDIRGKSLLDSFPKAVIYRITPKGFSRISCVGDNDIALMTCRNIRSAKEQKGKLHFLKDAASTCETYAILPSFTLTLYTNWTATLVASGRRILLNSPAH